MKSIRFFFTLLLLSLGTMVLLAAPAPAAASTLLESADYTFYTNLPDPAVWSVSAYGSVSQGAFDGLGLALYDSGNGSKWMYAHPTLFLGGNPNDPNFHNTATFRGRVQVPYVLDGSGAWSNGALGWRMILDDGLHRLELRLARSSSYVRQVRVENSTSIPALDFPWDNNLPNTYEITRLANGDFVVTLTNADISNPNPVHSMTIPGGLVPPSSGTPEFAWGAGDDGGGIFYWQEAQVEVADPASATALESLDYEFSFNLPDPAVWSVSAQGNVTQVPVDGVGLAMADPDNWSQLLYVHPTPYLSGDPNNPNYQNTATFRVRAKVPYINDGSSAWSTNAIGWRMILDDGRHRLELALSRDPTFARRARIQMSSFDPVSFPWDNGLANTYEITRLTGGDFVFTLTNADSSSPNPVVTQYISAGQLPGSGGTPLFAWGMAAEGGGAAYWQEVNVEVYGAAANQPPVAGPTSAPVDPVPVNTSVSVSAPFGDPDTGDTHTALWDWGDGTTTPATVDEAGGVGTASGEHTYAAPGVYPLGLTVSDNHGAAASATFQSVVVYDPSGGFVTGGGWIDSPAGAYLPDPGLAGKGSFGFVSKYQKGATVPSGNTQFQFKVADLSFHSSSYEWLVVNQAGTNAQFKGSGTINGMGDYRFMLWAGDGAADTFRIKIWEEVDGVEVVSFDNGAEQPIAGGAILVHKN